MRLKLLSPASALWLVIVSCITQGCDVGREIETGEAETPVILSSVPTSGVATVAQSATRLPPPTSATSAATSAATVQTPAAQATRIVTSPDGEWTASEVGGPHQPIDPRNPEYSRMFVGVEIEHFATGERWWPIALWEEGDIGSASPKVIGWRPSSAQVVLATVRCGDGCVQHCSHALSVFDGASGTTRSLSGPSWNPALDPTGRFVAGFGYESGEPPKRAIVVADLDAQTVVTATFPAEEVTAMFWAPDGSAVAFTVTDRYAVCGDHLESHLARFEIKTGEVSALTPVDARFRSVIRWNADNTLEVALSDDGRDSYDRPPDATELRDALSGALVAETVTDRTPDTPTAP